jgi:hypothetical protein
MPNRFSSGKFAIAHCDRCGFRFKLKQLKTLTIKTKNVNIRVCSECFEQDHPQLQLGMYPVNDPQAVRNPRPDTSYAESRSYDEVINIGPGIGLMVGVLSITSSGEPTVAPSYFTGGYLTGGYSTGGYLNISGSTGGGGGGGGGNPSYLSGGYMAGGYSRSGYLQIN